MNESITPPTIRVRISHDKTSKGWRCNETTVEITSPLEDLDVLREISYRCQAFLQSTHMDGLDEANRRNSIEGFNHG